MRVVFIGAGNVATHLSLAMQQAGMSIVQVYSHTESSAKCLSEKLHTEWTTDLNRLVVDADMYVFSVKDAVLPSVIATIVPNNALWVHTAGSMPLDVFKGYVKRYGVLYPLQTFSKERKISLQNVPLFLEASSEETGEVLQQAATLLSDNVRFLSSEKRKSLHLAAVFACNFTNHMYALAAKILEEKEIPTEVLLPLIDETAAKVHGMSPAEAQTGPAIRYDENVINKHQAMLSDSDTQELYRLISQSIHKEAIR